MKRFSTLLTAVFLTITFIFLLFTLIRPPIETNAANGLEPLLPLSDYGAWYQAATGYAPDAAWFGAYAIAPVGDAVYVGFGTARPSEFDGALLAKTDGVTITAVSTLSEQGFIGMTAVGETLYIPGVDPCCGDGWDFGNTYAYTPSVGLTKYRNLPNVVHSWGLWANEEGKLYTAVSHPLSVTVAGGALYTSVDRAQSWTMLAGRDDGLGIDRTYDVLGIGDKLYAVWNDVYEDPCGLAVSGDDGATWTRLLDEQIACRPRLVEFEGKLLALSADRAALYAVDEAGNTAVYAFPNFTVTDWAYNYAAVDGDGWLYLLTADGRVARTTNFHAWQTVAETDLELITIAWQPQENALLLSDRGGDAQLWKLDLQSLPTAPPAKHIILMIADGWGVNQIAAANAYAGTVPAYQTWTRHWVSTYPAGSGYDTAQAWSDFEYLKSGYTDSAAAATALYTGVKTENGRINADQSGVERLYSLTEQAREQGRGVGAVSSVYMSHATPGAWMAHNTARGNGYAIADEGYWGDPNTTGTIIDSLRYGGGMGPTLPPLDVLIGAGHPAWQGGIYINDAIRDKLELESGQTGDFVFVERQFGSPDGGERLLATANLSSTTRLAALFGGAGGNLEYRLADGSGHNPENPTLAEMATAALLTLNRSPNGFALMVEGGAVDWGGHANNLDRAAGEMIGFNEAVAAVTAWVDDPSNGSDWSNTLLIITGDHETGYLTAAPGVFPDQPLGEVSDATLALEKEVAGTGRRASWDDANNNDLIDAGETVYWAWNAGNHSNSLVPLYAKGAGAELFVSYGTGTDGVRGMYLDNTAVYQVMDAVFFDPTLYLPFVMVEGS